MKSIRETLVETVHLVMPEHTNPIGTLYGGRLMYWITETAFLCASRIARGPVTLGSMDGIDFLDPIRVREIVTVQAEVEYIGRSSMEVGVRVLTENPENQKKRVTTFAYLAFVAIDPQGRPRPIPETLAPKDPEEQQRYERAEARRNQRKQRLQKEPRLPDRGVSSWAPFPYTLEYTRMIFPEDTLAPNIMFSGRLFLDLDQAASILARRFVRGPVVTASFDATDFYAPIHQGDILIIQLALTYTGRTSIEIHARVMAEDPVSGDLRLTCSSYTTFVHLGQDGKPKPLPRRLTPLTTQEKQAFQEAEARKRARLERARYFRQFAEALMAQQTESPTD